MTLGRTSDNKLKIKTDGEAGLRAVECACCGPCSGCGSISQNTGGATSLSISLVATYEVAGEQSSLNKSNFFTFYINPCAMNAYGGNFSPYGCQTFFVALHIGKDSEDECVATISARAGNGILVAGEGEEGNCEPFEAIGGSKAVPVNQILGTHSLTNLYGEGDASPISISVTFS